MASEPHRISHVSDTALMTAACRALETERPDGWIRDPFARRVAGERGFAIAHALPGLEIMSFGVGMRSRILDDVVLQTIQAQRISTVLSVGAGLDTRPWRLELPAALRWIEVDLEAVLDYKARILASDEPTCRIERLVADLNDATQRRAMLSEASDGPALMITEGLLMYLPAATVGALAAEALAARNIRYWLLDLSTGDLARAVRMSSFKDIEAVRAPDNLDGDGIMRMLKEQGWAPFDSRTYGTFGMKLIPPARLEALSRLRESMGNDLPPPPPDTDVSGVHLFGRAWERP
jgi:methyltransferase (TIGR00027 family)